eukprot:XP_001699381.1 predicted protein [Chlamydomonas reinhardtii]
MPVELEQRPSCVLLWLGACSRHMSGLQVTPEGRAPNYPAHTAAPCRVRGLLPLPDGLRKPLHVPLAGCLTPLHFLLACCLTLPHVFLTGRETLLYVCVMGCLKLRHVLLMGRLQLRHVCPPRRAAQQAMRSLPHVHQRMMPPSSAPIM